MEQAAEVLPEILPGIPETDDYKLLFPEEARVLICPMGIGAEPVSIQGNVIGKRCIADLCMAWRWGDDETGFCGFVG